MKQITFAMIKPSCVKHAVEVEAAITAAGLVIDKVAEVCLSQAQAEEFYAEHKGKPFFGGLVAMLSSAPVRVYRISGENAVQAWRDLIGPTNPNNGNENQLRKRFADGEAYAAGSPDNGFHGSATEKDSRHELQLMESWGIL